MKLTIAIGALLSLSTTASAQMPNMALMQKWQNVNIVHYEVVGDVNDKHVQIPPVDADLYGDVVDRVTVSFDWDKNRGVLVGPAVFQNQAAKVTNLEGIGKGCPAGSLSGPYEHFDVVQVKAGPNDGTLELVGKRVHPDTMVTQACGSKPTPFKGAVKPMSEIIAAIDPMMLALGSAASTKTIKITPDGKSIVMTALNNNWTWTITPTPK